MDEVRKEIEAVRDLLEQFHEQLKGQVRVCAHTVESISLLEERLKELRTQEFDHVQKP